MANFIQAVKWMREGKKVKRKACDFILERDGCEHADIGTIDLRHLLDTDWEIACNNWNLADKKTNVSQEDGWQYQDKDIKTFIQKVKEDCEQKEKEYNHLNYSDIVEIIDKRASKLD